MQTYTILVDKQTVGIQNVRDKITQRTARRMPSNKPDTIGVNERVIYCTRNFKNYRNSTKENNEHSQYWGNRSPSKHQIHFQTSFRLVFPRTLYSPASYQIGLSPVSVSGIGVPYLCQFRKWMTMAFPFPYRGILWKLQERMAVLLLEYTIFILVYSY